MCELEKIQKDSLYTIFEMKRTSPYEAFLAEIGLLSIADTINLKRIKLYHNTVNSDERRIAKHILNQ